MEQNEIMEMMDEAIKQGLNTLGTTTCGTEDYRNIADDLRVLYQLRNDHEKILEESRLKERQMDMDHILRDEEIHIKEIQIEEQKKDRWVNIGLQTGLALLSVVTYNIWYNRGLKFEETGSVNSSFVRNLINRVKPTK